MSVYNFNSLLVEETVDISEAQTWDVMMSELRPHIKLSPSELLDMIFMTCSAGIQQIEEIVP